MLPLCLCTLYCKCSIYISVHHKKCYPLIKDCFHFPVGRKMKDTDAELKQYMDQMDRELANTTLAESFEKKPAKSKSEQKVSLI